MSGLPVLYSFRRCPYAMRARMAIAVSGVKVELREVALRDKPAELGEVSPKATVPVLVLQNGAVIDESLDIMRWALGHSDPEGWLLRDDAVLIAVNDGPFKKALDGYKYPDRVGAADGLAGRAQALVHLVALDDRLARNRFLHGPTCGLSDIALFPFVRQFAAVDQAWFGNQPLQALQAWLNELTRSALFDSIMQRYPQWRAGDDPTIFPG